ncbi:MAG: lasso peptide biosynthesis B2 protein [Hyphomonadaceae bacterium]|nr:lasso peptide biosynthesis B2 protein [Hyphomonadaceae bacterium]
MAASSELSNPSGNQLVLGSEVYFCVTEGQGIFLDLKSDDYSAIPLVISPANCDDRDCDAAIREGFEVHRQDLLDAHLLREDAQGRDNFQAFKSLLRPVVNIFHPDDQRAFGIGGKLGQGVRVGVADVLDFFLASYRASQLLKKQHIYDVVHGVRRRKAVAGKGANDLDALRGHTAIYRKLRPWYPRGYLCLYDGLALIEFLARRKLFPAWVFGVQAQPFGAHCWVQQGDVLLNEATEYAGQFTPIMSV